MHKRLSLALAAALLLTSAFAQTSTGTSTNTTGTSRSGIGHSGTATRGTGGMSMNMAPMNVNTATLAQLERIPGMSRKLAQEVIAARAKGPFKNEQDFVKRVKGIGTQNVKKFQQYLKFS